VSSENPINTLGTFEEFICWAGILASQRNTLPSFPEVQKLLRLADELGSKYWLYLSPPLAP
jgi:hypothetical protein